MANGYNAQILNIFMKSVNSSIWLVPCVHQTLIHIHCDFDISTFPIHTKYEHEMNSMHKINNRYVCTTALNNTE